MAQKLIQTQEQTQNLTLTPQQLLLVRLVELPVSELESRVRDELADNEALEVSAEPVTEDEESAPSLDESEGDRDDRFDDARTDGISDDIAADYLTADDIPDYVFNVGNQHNTNYEMPQEQTESFYEELLQQARECNLTPHQHKLLEYLIGSLDGDGFLRKELDTLVDELAVYQNIETNKEELRKMLGVLQHFEPKGIGARNLKECLRLQIDVPEYKSKYKTQELQIIDVYFDDLVHKRSGHIMKRLNLTTQEWEDILKEFQRLNPRPGNALNESNGIGAQSIIPDFTVVRDENDRLTVHLNYGDVPELRVSNAFLRTLNEFSHNKGNLNRDQRNAYLYSRQKVESAKTFIDAIRMRRHTLYSTMEAIVEYQRAFFLEGDELLLKPLRLQDIAERTKFDKSTISRVARNKYVQTEFGVFPLKFFFTEGVVIGGGEEHSAIKIKNKLKELIDKEDKQHPLKDEDLAILMKDAGFPVARRTIAKYREQMSIPVARLRK